MIGKGTDFMFLSFQIILLSFESFNNGENLIDIRLNFEKYTINVRTQEICFELLVFDNLNGLGLLELKPNLKS